MSDELDRRQVFDRAAAIYHDARPTYPDPIFERLMQLLPPEPFVIEVGPGTGQATQQLLQRRARVRAVEIGPNLAVELAQQLSHYADAGQLEVINADYERLDPQGGIADAVVSATAYHWISPAEQLSRPLQWLKPTGRLAVIDTVQVASDVDGGYFEAAQPIYERYGQATGTPADEPDVVTPGIHRRMVGDERCIDITLDRSRWDQTYDSSSYRALLNTYSGTLAMAEPSRTEMVDELVQLVDDLGGQVTRPLVITLATCRFGSD